MKSSLKHKAFSLSIAVEPPGNNSNTFIREMARVIGRDADVIGGNHPGAIYAQPVAYPGYTPVRRYIQ